MQTIIEARQDKIETLTKKLEQEQKIGARLRDSIKGMINDKDADAANEYEACLREEFETMRKNFER